MNYRINIKAIWMITMALLIAGCSELSPQATPTEEPPPIDDFTPLVSATGVVVPAQSTTLSVSTAGIVAEVLIEEGETVEADQVLIRLRGTEDLQAAIAAAEYEITLAQKALDDLDKNASDKSVELLESIGSLSTAVRDAKYELDNFTVPTNQEDLEAVEAMDLTKKNLDIAREAYEPYKDTAEDEYFDDVDCAINSTWIGNPDICEEGGSIQEELKEDLDDAQSDYNAAVRRLQYETTLATLEENLEKARQDYELYDKGPDPADVAVTQSRLDNAEASLAAAQALLEDLEVRAPFAGTVSELYITEGEWVSPGQLIILLADLGNLRVETTDLSEIDVARVDIDNTVIVAFDALPDASVTGIVTRIAPKAASGSGVNYTIVIELQEIPENLRWGMTAFVDIEVE